MCVNSGVLVVGEVVVLLLLYIFTVESRDLPWEDAGTLHGILKSPLQRGTGGSSSKSI